MPIKQLTLKWQDVKYMLQQLKETALQYVSIPASFTLKVEDFDEDGATFLWSEQLAEDGYYVRLSADGKLLSLSQPASASHEIMSAEQQQAIAEQFITTQYEDALHYFTLQKLRLLPPNV